MGNPFEDLRQAVVVRPMNSPGPQGAAGPELKIQYSVDGASWHDNPLSADKYLRFSTDNGVIWSDAIYFNNLSETLAWVEKARQWAENPENDEVEPGQYSALHHALRSARSALDAESAALYAESAAIGAFGVPPAPWNSTTVYNYNDIVNFGNGHIYRCIGTNVVGATHAPNINGIDNEEDWARITVVLDGYFEVDENGDFMSAIAPVNSEIFMLDENGDIMYQDPINLQPNWATIELFTIDENEDITYRDPVDHRPGGGNIELYKKIDSVDSIADFRNASFYGTTEYVYVAGYYGAGTPGGGMFYRDPESIEDDNGGTIIVDGDGVRWKRANVHEEYYASWFGVSTHLDDNSPLIQNALNTMPCGAKLIFGPGIYNCKQTIKLPFYDQYYSPSYMGITIEGSTKVFHSQVLATRLIYTGPNPETLTPFFDFKCRSTFGDSFHFFCGAIRNISFESNDVTKNIVGLWFYETQGLLLEGVRLQHFKCGIRIDGWCICNDFYNVIFNYCYDGIILNGVGNATNFYSCIFRGSYNVGLAHNLAPKQWGESGIYINGGVFENCRIAIKSRIGLSLYISKCYFESNPEYIIDVFESSWSTHSLISIENSCIDYHPGDSFIRQNTSLDHTLTFVANNNVFFTDKGKTYNSFIYVQSGNIIIKAENNKMSNPEYTYPICSKTPLKTSYFNNDFSDTN